MPGSRLLPINLAVMNAALPGQSITLQFTTDAPVGTSITVAATTGSYQTTISWSLDNVSWNSYTYAATLQVPINNNTVPVPFYLKVDRADNISIAWIYDDHGPDAQNGSKQCPVQAASSGA